MNHFDYYTTDNSCLPQSVLWLDGTLKILDQNSVQYPYNLQYIETTTLDTIIIAIKNMSVRGAPAIGLVGGYGLVLAAMRSKATSSIEFIDELTQIGTILKKTRPTAVNLVNVIDRLISIISENGDISQLKSQILEEMKKIHYEEENTYKYLSKRGSELINESVRVITHCNTGTLATGTSYGTALGIIKYAHQGGKLEHVYVTETRPRFQGLKITSWELQQLKIPFTVLVDSAIGYLMSQKKIDCVLVGADRILLNEDPSYYVLNKIGTLPLAILANYFDIPFIVAAPYSTFDRQLKLNQITIELRKSQELTEIQGFPIAPDNINVLNPAFDITPPELITAIVTDKDIIRPNE